MLPVLARLDVAGVTVTLYTYSTFLVLAAAAAVALATLGAVRLGASRGSAVAWYGVALAAGLVGARLLDVVLDRGAYAADPGQVVALEFRGFALFGGLLAGTLLALAAARRWRVSGWRLADSAVPAVAAGIVLMRIGCFLNGCCSGIPTDLPWGVSFPVGSSSWELQLAGGRTGIFDLGKPAAPVHPTQLYEAGAAIACCLLALVLRRRGVSPGVPALAFVAGFALLRAANQLLRPELPTATLPAWTLLVLYLAVGVGGAWLLVARWRAGFVATAIGPPGAGAARSSHSGRGTVEQGWMQWP